ncbi:MAG: PAS domain S-box protein [Bacteroidales bacterium]|nr:PAS domain S-box protein [Bacteroidales bacterium]
MEKKEIGFHLLLDIVLKQFYRGESDEIIKHALPLYHEYLGCSMVAILTNEGNQFAYPEHALENHSWKQIKDKVLFKTDSSLELESNGLMYYKFRLGEIGQFVIACDFGLPEDVKNSLQQVVTQLSRCMNRADEEQHIKLMLNLLDNSSGSFVISHESGSLYYVNKCAEHLLGFTQSECYLYSVSDFELYFDTTQKWEEHVVYLREHTTQLVEGEILNQRTKKITPVEVMAKHITINQNSYIIADIRDISQRKEYQNQLLETTQKHARILWEMTDVVYSLRVSDKKLLFLTPSVIKLFEEDLEDDYSGTNLIERVIYKEDVSVYQVIKEELEITGEFSVKHRISTKNGKIKWVIHKGKYVLDEHNVPIQVVGLIIDNSHQRMAEEQLEQERKLKDLLIDIASTYINLDLTKLSSTINDSLEKMGKFVSADRAYIFDYDFEAETTTNTYEWCADGISPEIDNLQDLPIMYFPQWVAAHKIGEPFYVPSVQELFEEDMLGLRAILEPQGIKSLITLPMLDGEELVGFVGFDSVTNYHNYSENETKLLFLYGQMLINIRGRQMREKQLALKEEKYRNIIKNMNLGLLEINLEDEIVFANQSFCKMSGYNNDDLKGKKGSDFYGSIDYRESYHSDLSELDNITDLKNEIEVFNKQGERKWWYYSVSPQFSDKGELTGYIGVQLDITGQKELERELERAKASSDAAANAKQLFLASMSHEIRTPLNVIIGMIRQLSKEKLNDQQVFYVKQSELSARHLLTILNNILDVAKIESAEIDMNHKEFNVHSLVQNVHSILFAQAKEKNLLFVIDVDSTIQPCLIGDEVRIRQVLFNLIGNAIKFTDYGKVEVSIIILESNPEIQRIQFKVVDTGIGMSEQFVSKVFEKFSREYDSTAGRRFEGTGLGMSIASDLVRMMHGDLKITSVKGKGTTVYFELELPVGKLENLVQIRNHTESPDYSDKTILLVEDNEMNRFIAIQSLEVLNCAIDEAENGRIAVEMVKRKEYDLILMDILMPEMDGMEATKIIRNELMQKTPIVALTANAFKHDIDTYLAAGMDDFITKPFDENDFLRKIEHQLNKSSSQLNAPVSVEASSFQSPIENQKLYDLSYLIELSRGRHEFVKKMMILFCNLIEENANIIEDAYRQQDLKTIQQTAHRIKPSVNQMGVHSLSDKIRELELYSMQNGSWDLLGKLIQTILGTLRLVVSEIREKELE